MQRVEAADYRDIVQVSDPQLSSSGDRLAFVSTRAPTTTGRSCGSSPPAAGRPGR